MKGFSRSNLQYMRAFAETWPDQGSIGQQPVGQLPWGHNLVLLTKLKTPEARLAHAARAVVHGWSLAFRQIHRDKDGRCEAGPSGALGDNPQQR